VRRASEIPCFRQIGRLRSSLVLLQHRNDLLFRELDTNSPLCSELILRLGDHLHLRLVTVTRNRAIMNARRDV